VALSNLAVGDVAVTGVAFGPWTVEFTGTTFGNLNVSQLAVLATEVMQGGGPSFATAIQGASGTVAELVKGGNTVATELMRGNSLGVVTTQGGTAVLNEVQQVTFAPVPTGGTFILNFNGQLTTPLPFFASAAAVDAALEALPLIGANNVSVTAIANGWQVTFVNGLGTTNVTQLVAADNEIQRVTNPNPGQSFTLNFSGQVTRGWPATRLPPKSDGLGCPAGPDGPNCLSGGVSGPWDVQFIGAIGNLADFNANAIAINNAEIQRVSLAVPHTGGAFTLSLGAGPQTALIAHDALPIDVQNALNAVLGGGSVTVTGVAGGPWDVRFSGAAFVLTDVQSLVIRVNETQVITPPVNFITGSPASEDLYAGVANGSALNPGGVLVVDQVTGSGVLLADNLANGLSGLDFTSTDRLFGTTTDRQQQLVEFDPDTGAILSVVLC
jgi:hypothetical protein